MPDDLIKPRDIEKLQQKFGPVMVDMAVRQTLINENLLSERDSIGIALFREPDVLARVNKRAVAEYLEYLSLVGKPLTPASPVPGGQRTIGQKIGIRGNPPEFDVKYAGGWHFSQSNRWDAWFTFIPMVSGGFRVATPAARLRGEHGPAMLGGETYAQFHEHNGHITFAVAWPNGSVGHYSGGFSGEDFLGNAGGDVIFEASRMPQTEVIPPVVSVPVISCEAIPNTMSNGYTITIGGSGFRAGDYYQVQGRVVGNGLNGDWGAYAEGTVDALGQMRAVFGIIKPLGHTYVFRAFGQSSGYTVEIGV